MPEQKKLTLAEKQELLIDTQLETAMVTLERTKKDNQLYTETEDDRQRKRDQAQLQAKSIIEAQTQRERNCQHMAGVQAGDVNGHGVGGSCLSASRIGFTWMWLIQCVWCGLKNITPHPGRKTSKPQRIKIGGGWRLETADEVKARVKLYNDDLERHNDLRKQAKSNGLPPMVGPAWDFQDEDGSPVIPALR